ncbi:MAG: 16S rRNA (cytosine(1402)-N(4))-methyltransferase RsmH [Thermodesulfobacteriota bacterium]
MDREHTPVMTREVLEYLDCRPGGTYVDGTLGGGGHAREILEATGPDGRLVGIDRDGDALKEAGALLEPYGKRALLVREDFREIKRVLADLGIGTVDGMVLDLGVSSYQLESPERGFSFRHDARLDMRMDTRQELSAYDLVNGLSAEDLERIFRDYGEERAARRIARAIEKKRGEGPITTTDELAGIVAGAAWRAGGKGGKRGRGARGRGGAAKRKIHPATRVFQALRIAVNDELESLKAGLTDGIEALGSGGRMVVISFHSLEDRIVKNCFRDLWRGCVCPPEVPVCVCGKEPSLRLLTKRVVFPSDAEVERNPRARSARFRAAEKI